ncbi:11232_t:CDS:2 [Cetraspora pellucida]|uniref:11232_t:CDS:1 n=1 Tax=Cetraspora pellucida TaxID=1433469 RepID=A0ACA9K4Y2_9GLOM|nr:11232_t:CDS:2 [Cetraspora pellucida]
MGDPPKSDDIKKDWKKKYIERIQNPSCYKKTKPSLPNSSDPESWKKYRIDLSEYLEHSLNIINAYKKTVVESKNTPKNKLSRDIDTNPFSYYKNEALASLWDVEDNISTLIENLNLEYKLMTVDETLQQKLKNYGSSFGGTYVDIKEKKVIINTLNNSLADEIKASLEKENHKNMLEFMSFIPAPKKKSMVELSSSFQNITQLIYSQKPTDIQCYIDVKINNVVIRYENGITGRFWRFFSEVKKFEPELIIPNARHKYPGHKRANDLSLRGYITTQIWNGDGMSSQRMGTCSLGFWARAKGNVTLNYIVTAGHCFDEKYDRSKQKYYYSPWDSSEVKHYLGTMDLVRNKGTYDFGIINLQDRKIGATRIRNSDSFLYNPLFIVGSRVPTSYGVHVCKSGKTTHITCGYVKGLGAVTTNTFGVIRTDVILAGKDDYQTCITGDSGGSSFSYLQDLRNVVMVGITSSSFEDFNEYVPIDIILNKAELELMIEGDDETSTSS